METVQCVITGTETELVEVGDELVPPPGWVEIRVVRRTPNPKFLLLTQVRKAQATQVFQQVPKQDRHKGLKDMIAIQLEAQYAALEAKPEYQPVLTEEDAVFVSPHASASAEGKAEIERLFTTLGLDVNGTALEPDAAESDDDT